MTGTVSIVHDEQHGRRQINVRLGGFDYPLAVPDQHVDPRPSPGQL